MLKPQHKQDVQSRKLFLIDQLGRMGVTENKAGVKLDKVRLAELEWLHVEEQNKVAELMREEEE